MILCSANIHRLIPSPAAIPSTMVRERKLKKETQFGRIPFDLYALEKWDYDAPIDSDGDQWKTLVKSYLSLPRIQRRPYHEKANLFKTQKNDGSQPNLVREKINRVLRPFQTNNERNLSELCSSSNPVWVRLCYDKALESRYIEMVPSFDAHINTDMMRILDDKELYDLDDDPERLRLKLLERMPGYCDKDRSDYQANQGRSQRQNLQDLESLGDRMSSYFCFVDREAIEQDLYKIMWLDSYENCLLITKITPDELEDMTVMFGEGFSMEEAVESYGLHDSDNEGGESAADSDSEGGDEGKEEHEGSGPAEPKRKCMSAVDAAVEASRKRGRINKTSPEYKAGYKAGCDAGAASMIAAAQDIAYDTGYADGKNGRPHRKYGPNFM
ncbi:uncharacterized protein F5Z01DRAFT_649484 [Emericellopsis atlantica]|uniref:Uncharacterized protein n=1 Tax=Emericellopsis atlantica TaxID=2614577 RepID=A0A9P7ZQ15_9HYPO|nr:uncharacterized protein F5Z01DRAFT_649484 [Emericellopsis atlantica]KAG9256219.1 hypothetical protein F5Z01DRAFT_649484 [Emericellopsis atlantica]